MTTTLDLARTYTINALGSIGTRYVVSEAAGLPKKKALIFNGVDMLVNTTTSFIFSKCNKSLNVDSALLNFLASRAISVIAAACITSYTVGRIDLGAAFAIDTFSILIGAILRLAESNFFMLEKTDWSVFM